MGILVKVELVVDGETVETVTTEEALATNVGDELIGEGIKFPPASDVTVYVGGEMYFDRFDLRD